jgi:cholesterol oxidase
MSIHNGTVTLEFTEDMKGFVAFGQTNYEEGYKEGKEADTYLRFHLTIKTDDLDRFLRAPEHEAKAIGYIECEQLGGRRPVEKGTFNLFVDSADLNRKKMTYRLFMRDTNGQPLTLSGFKSVQDNVGLDVWKDTTTLFTNIFGGHISQDQEPSAPVMAAGILRIKWLDFLKQLTTFRTDGPTFSDRVEAIDKFGKYFLGSLWEVYGPSCTPKMIPYEREIPLYTTEGITGAEITTHPFVTADKLSLSLLRFRREPCDDVVLILHGLTTSSDMFIMPEHYNLVQYLLDHGFTDVWTLDFRMSNRFIYNLSRNRFNMDDIALYDYPPALATMREQIGLHCRIHVICHCLGSVSFMMSLFGKTVDGIASAIANSVALTPRIPAWSRVKLAVGPFLCDYLAGIDYLNPHWRREPGFSIGKLLARCVSLLHRECDVPECHMLSFMWGSGFPALYRHENLLDVTHRRGGDLYGGVSVHYYRHVQKMVSANHTAVKYETGNPKYRALPDNYFEYVKEIKTPVLFITGEQNKVFTDSNIVCHERLEKIVPGRHELHVFPNYGHQDVFMGKNNHIDIFPRLLQFLEKHREKGAG